MAELSTPVEIDTRLAELWAAAEKARSYMESARLSLASSVGIRPHYATRTRREVRETWAELLALAERKLAADDARFGVKENMERTIERYNSYKADLAAARAEAEPLEAIFNERHWSRFFLVTSSNGHIHSSMNCSTCRIRTQFAWLPTLSGLTEKDAVEAHGPLLCSVCYPSAPVEWTVGPKVKS
jgi:hypothetical protein